jgi:serine protease Do
MISRRTVILASLVTIGAVGSVGVLANNGIATTPLAATAWQTPAMNGTPITDEMDITAATVRRIAAEKTPGVVNIRTESRRQTRDLQEWLPDERFEFFFGPRSAPRDEILEGAGSGFIIDGAGFILTNNHVVEGANRIEVGFFTRDGQDADELYEAKVVGRDPLTDSALLQLTEKPSGPLTVIPFGDSDQMAPGDWVIAIGNPFNLARTVTVGVISAKGRPFAPVTGRVQEMLQTDAAINPGNSGGPLLNLRGDVVGINTAILGGRARAGNLGIGFAVPINVVRELLPELRSGKVTRGWIGVQVTNVPKAAVDEFGLSARKGVVVAAVEPGGPAADAGLQPGDVIVEYDGKPVANTTELTRLVVETAPETRAQVRVIRNKAPESLTIRVEALSLEEGARVASDGDRGTGGFGLSLGSVPSAMTSRPEGGGALVRGVERGSAAASAGLRPGDVILEVNRQRVSGPDDAARLLRQAPADASVFVLVWRDGDRLFLTMTRED